jgi:hypothetical protein
MSSIPGRKKSCFNFERYAQPGIPGLLPHLREYHKPDTALFRFPFAFFGKSFFRKKIEVFFSISEQGAAFKQGV